MGRAEHKMNTAEGSILVNAPIGRVYRQWLRVEEFPKFMSALKAVQKADSNHFSIAIAYNGQQYVGVLEIMLRVPERRVAWRLRTGGESSPDHFATGVVSFTSRADGSTCVTLKISSHFNGDVALRVDKCLQNFKQLIDAPA